MIAMRLGGFACGFGMLLCGGQAHAQYEGAATVILDQLETSVDAERAFARQQSILKVKVIAPLAVRLDGDVDFPAGMASKAAVEEGVPMRAGTILTTTEPLSGRYCLEMRPRRTGFAGPCLVDVDRDGKFDYVMKAGYTSRNARGISITRKGDAVGTLYFPVGGLAVPVGYTKLDEPVGTAATGTLRWLGKAPKTVGSPVELGFIMTFMSRGGPMSWVAEFTFTGEPLVVDVYGLKIKVLGFDENKALRLKMESFQRGGSVPLQYVNEPQTIYVSY